MAFDGGVETQAWKTDAKSHRDATVRLMRSSFGWTDCGSLSRSSVVSHARSRSRGWRDFFSCHCHVPHQLIYLLSSCSSTDANGTYLYHAARVAMGRSSCSGSSCRRSMRTNACMKVPTSPDQFIFEVRLRVRPAMLRLPKRGNISRVSPAPPDKTIEEILQFPMGKTSPFAFVLRRMKMEKICLGLALEVESGNSKPLFGHCGSWRHPGDTPWTALQLAAKR